MANDLIVPVILAGGKGTRLWPMSRSQRPKQFLPLTGDLSLFQLTLKRLADPTRYDKPIVVTNAELLADAFDEIDGTCKQQATRFFVCEFGCGCERERQAHATVQLSPTAMGPPSTTTA